jgi:hypothetical protein
MAGKKSKAGKGKPGKGTGKKPSPPVVRAALVTTQNTVAFLGSNLPGPRYQALPFEQQLCAPGAV